jgi:hypothetical protein
VAGFRLVFPLSIESIFSLIPFKAQAIPPDIGIQPIPRIDSGVPIIDNIVSGSLPAPAIGSTINPLQIWTAISAIVWIVGLAVMFIYGVGSFVVLKQKMRKAVHIEANIYEAENIKSPFVLGIFTPRIFIPIGLSARERSYILLHEQTHIRRRDHIMKFAAYFVLCLHWFNPFVWAAFHLMSTDMEMSCDERVLKEMGGETRKDYSLSLLSLATERSIAGGSPLAFGENGVKNRIKNVLNFRKPSRIIIVASIALVAVLSVGFAVNSNGGAFIFSDKETTDKYSFHLGERSIEDVLLPDEYEFLGRPTLNGDDMNSRLVTKYFFTYNEKEYYIYYSHGLEYHNTTYSDIYNAETDEKWVTLWEKPQGLFMLGDYLYYAYGKEYRVREFNWHNFYFYYLHYKDFHFARLNLNTMKNESITRQQYEETWDYQDFREWRSTAYEPITSLDVFVWLGSDDNYDTYFTLKNGSNPKYKEDWYEHFIYHLKDAPTFSVYNSPNLITNKLDEFNKMIAKYPDVEKITIYQMKSSDFTDKEMTDIGNKIIVPNASCKKTIALW